MEITEIRIHPQQPGHHPNLKAFVTITFDGCFAVRNMKIVEVEGRTILCMPSRKLQDGSFKDVAHPINAEFRAHLEREVFSAYEAEMRRPPRAEAGSLG
jgi:stage V sporulation protein G